MTLLRTIFNPLKSRLAAGEILKGSKVCGLHGLQPASMGMPIDHDQQLLLYWRW